MAHMGHHPIVPVTASAIKPMPSGHISSRPEPPANKVPTPSAASSNLMKRCLLDMFFTKYMVISKLEAKISYGR